MLLNLVRVAIKMHGQLTGEATSLNYVKLLQGGGKTQVVIK